MPRLMDLGIERLKRIMLEMADLSENTVSTAIQAYMRGQNLKDEVFQRSEQLRALQDEIGELAVDIIARYQPVASDLRFIKSCMEISYGFSRFGRYAYDISDMFTIYGDLSGCDKSAVEAAGSQTREMIRIGIQAFANRDVELAQRLKPMDDVVDNIYREFLNDVVAHKGGDMRCYVSGALILRYLERIADHAAYMGESVLYVAGGRGTPRP